LTSSCSGIVHTVSGRCQCAHTRISRRGLRSVDGAPSRVPTSFSFLAPLGLPPKDSRIGSTPWSVLQDGVFLVISFEGAPIPEVCARTSRLRRSGRGAAAARLPAPAFESRGKRAQTGNRPTRGRQPHWREKVSSLRFHALLTSSSGYFSSFAHATCSLSVSRSYLAFEGIYLRLRAAIPNNPTLRAPFQSGSARTRGCHPRWRTLSSDTYRASPQGAASTDYNSPSRGDLGLSSSLFTRSY